MLGAGDRMARHEQAGRGQMRDHVAHDLRLDRADVGDDGLGGQARAASPRRPRPTAAGGTPSTTRSAPRDRLGRVGLGPVAQAQLQRARRGSRSWRAQATISPAAAVAPQHGRERAVDQPDAHHRDAAERRHAVRPPGDEVAQGRDQAAVLLLEPDADAQAVAAGRRRPSGAGSTPSASRCGVGGGGVAVRHRRETRPGGSCRGSGRRAGRGRRARARARAARSRLWRARRLGMRLVRERRHAGGLRRQRDVERAAHAVDHVDDPGRRGEPAEAQGGEAVELGEGAHRHRVGRRAGQLQAAVIVGCLGILGVGRVDHQDHVGGQAGAQPPQLRRRQVAAGRVVRVGEEDQPRARGDVREQRVDIGA